MSQFSWESEVMEQPQLEQQADQHPDQPFADPGTLAMSVDDFAALEERILRAVNLVKRERLARAEAEERAVQAEMQFRDQAPRIEQMQKELDALLSERDHVRQRVERLLQQLDALEL